MIGEMRRKGELKDKNQSTPLPPRAVYSSWVAQGRLMANLKAQFG